MNYMQRLYASMYDPRTCSFTVKPTAEFYELKLWSIREAIIINHMVKLGKCSQVFRLGKFLNLGNFGFYRTPPVWKFLIFFTTLLIRIIFDFSFKFKAACSEEDYRLMGKCKWWSEESMYTLF